MHKAVEAYRAASIEYDAAQEEAKSLARDLRNIGNSMSYFFNEFLASNYEMKFPHKYQNADYQKFRFDMNKWPSAEIVDRKFKRLSLAYNRLQRAWAAIPADDQSFLRPPDIYIRLNLDN